MRVIIAKHKMIYFKINETQSAIGGVYKYHSAIKFIGKVYILLLDNNIGYDFTIRYVGGKMLSFI